MSKVIVHIDLNAFFVRAEEIKDPSLEGKSVAIGHEGRSGIVSTCSYEARKYGVRSGMAMFKAKELCPHLIIKHGDYRFYSALSNVFMNFIRNYTQLVEVASIDECYADFTEVVKNKSDIPGFLRTIQKELYQKTKLQCSIGVGTTKFLAKMGSDYQKPMGLTIIRNKDIPLILYPLPIDSMYGIGKKTAPRLKQEKIFTIGDLANVCQNETKKAQSLLGKFFYVIDDWLKGKGDDEVIPEPFDPKSIGSSSTLPHDTSDFDEIKKRFYELSNEVSKRAKKENKFGTTIQIVVKESTFETHNKSISFETPTNDSSFIYRTAVALFEKHFTSLTVRLVGVTLQNLIDSKNMVIQISLFEYEKIEEENKTKLLINELNRRLKKPSLMRASEIKRSD